MAAIARANAHFLMENPPLSSSWLIISVLKRKNGGSGSQRSQTADRRGSFCDRLRWKRSGVLAASPPRSNCNRFTIRIVISSVRIKHNCVSQGPLSRQRRSSPGCTGMSLLFISSRSRQIFQSCRQPGSRGWIGEAVPCVDRLAEIFRRIIGKPYLTLIVLPY